MYRLRHGKVKTYPLLGELTGTLVLAVTEQFDDSALVWGKTVQSIINIYPSTYSNQNHHRNGMENNIPRDLLDNLPNKLGALAQMTLGSANSGLGDTSLGFL
jgi:hypothetical protein